MKIFTSTVLVTLVAMLAAAAGRAEAGGGEGDPPGSTPPATTIEHLQKDLAKELPAGIDVEIDEQFDAMLSYKAKNYALLTNDGEVIIKGGALKSRGLEKFQRVFLEEMIKMIMQGKPEAIAGLKNEFEQKLLARTSLLQYLTFQFFAVSVLLALPVKLFLRLVFTIKYVWVTPWFNI